MYDLVIHVFHIGFIREVKGYGKLGNVDKIQILTFEQLIDQGKQYDLPV